MGKCFDSLFREENVSAAINHLMEKGNTAGVDGVLLHDIGEYWDDNHEQILSALKAHSFSPGVVKEFQLLQPNGKQRTLIRMNAIDRLLLRCIVQEIQPVAERALHPKSFAFRVGKGVKPAVRTIAQYVQDGFDWVAEIDIKDYFASVSLDRMESLLPNWFEDEDVCLLISRFIHAKVAGEFHVIEKAQGLLQGSPLSPLLSNIYLHDLDTDLGAKKYSFIRYCDNIYVFTRSYEEALNKLNYTRKQLLKEYGLEIHPEKTGVYQSLNRSYLGYVLTRSEENGRIYFHKQKKERREVYSRWKTTAIQKVDRNYHIINDGILTRKDFTVLFEGEDGKRYIPVETTDSINVYANVKFSSELLRVLADRNLSINVFDQYGNFAGRFLGNGVYSASAILLKQVECYLDPARRKVIATSIIVAGIHNMRAVIRYYMRRKNQEIFRRKEAELTGVITKIQKAADVEHILMLEAQARQHYYQTFPYIVINEDFAFVRRTRRPPKDAINALISFGNTILYNRLASEIQKSSLDIRIAYLHSTNNRRYSLNLDLAEVFKPIIVDRVIFSCINRGMLDAKQHFEKMEKDGVYLTSEGKQIFIREFEKKLYSELTVKDERMTYDTLLRREVRAFQMHMSKGEAYKPYKSYY